MGGGQGELPGESSLQLCSGCRLCSLGIEPRYGTTNSITEFDCSCKQGLLRSSRVEVEVVPGGPAPEALIDVSPQVGRKASAPGRGRAMHGAAAPNLVTGMLAGHEAEQFQHLSHGHARTHFFISKARHGSNAARSSRNPLSRPTQQRRGVRNGDRLQPPDSHCSRFALPRATQRSRCPRATQLRSTPLQAVGRINLLECVCKLGKSSRKFFWKSFSIPQWPRYWLRSTNGRLARARPRKWPYAKALLTHGHKNCRQRAFFVHLVRFERANGREAQRPT